MIYLDSSAVVKLVHLEAGTRELVSFLGERPSAPLVSSALVEVEVPRAVRRHAPGALAGVPAVLSRLHRLGIDDVVRATAAAFEDGSMRTLDAIHLGTALVLMAESSQDLEAFVAYDRRLLSAAAAMEMPIHSPGQE